MDYNKNQISHLFTKCLLLVAGISCFWACQPNLNKSQSNIITNHAETDTGKADLDTVSPLFEYEELFDPGLPEPPPPLAKIDSLLTEVIQLDSTILLDLKYASPDNFTKEQLYICGRCYLRHWAANALVVANREVQQHGYRLKLWDCYRPLGIQKHMFDIVPNKTWVADPEEGSMHNRGLAVDLTLVDSTGQELEMGTPFDFFGPEARPAYQGHSETVNTNRQLLRSAMINAGFTPIRSEWWHYSMDYEANHKVLDLTWECLD